MLLKSYSEVIGSKSGLFGIERKTDTACITIVRNNNWDHGRKGAFWECGESDYVVVGVSSRQIYG